MTPAPPPRQRRRRRWPFIVVGAVLVVVLAVVVTGAVVLKRAPSVSSLSEAHAGAWSSVTLGSPARNGDGSAYNIFVKPGTGKGLMVFFGDGGLNFTAETAVQPVSLATTIFGGDNFYSDHLPFYEVNTFGGLLSASDQNPFAGYTTVVIPTTTGDLGVGDTTTSTVSKGGQAATSVFNGYANTRAALDWVYANVPSPDTVMVAGTGTGGLSSAIWLGDVGAHYRTQPLTEYSDSSFIEASSFPIVIDGVWQADFEHRFGFSPTRSPLTAATVYNTGLFGSRLTTLLSQTLLDRSSAAFSAELDDGYYSPQAGADWNFQLKSALRTLTASDVGATVFVTNYGADAHGETPGLLATGDLFGSATQDGVTLEQFVTRAVQGGHPVSAGLALLEQ
ncbi:hypothetical protein [Subtercola sp. RTI3]|uniref:hypothetical protein n=1 Tax=Subtercola sp. RTI3 TaxID=3048639 RepID=UPI002B222171|nr:hypothetical protein [Subtercola sp. RTI3]MEA9986162.1 hypothetical protein [Subtercola sp. RTI3]